MAVDPRIDDLLSVWDAAPVKPELELLCRTCPDLLEPLRQRVTALQEADRLLNTGLLVEVGLDRPPPISDPEQIGQYRILGKIGEGGMGVVYRAEQREPVRRMVALKLIKLGMDSREVIARFEAERQALALMNHPNVAKVLEAGITDTGRPYFAMELVQGIDFIHFCEDEKLQVRQRIELFIPVCQAVQHAHQKGIIHRDLKPSNILVQLIDGKPVPKVIDFGIAKATNQVLTQHTLFTKTGAMIGTPEYMSPEQAMTSGLDVDTRTDIYSLGVILYQLLTGTLPIDPRVLREAGLEGMARLIKNTEPQKPSTRLLRRSGGGADSDRLAAHTRDTRLLHKELQDDLDWIVLKAMEKDRSRRYETANALAIDLERHLDGQTVLARPPSTLYRVQKFVSKHQLTVAAGTAVMVALLVAVISVSWAYVNARKQTKVANNATLEAERQKTVAVANETKAKDSANQAAENLSTAELRLADGHVAQADALTMANRIADARKLYHQAISEFTAIRQSAFRGDVGLSAADIRSPPPLLTLKGHADSVYGVAFSPDGRYVLSGSRDQYVRRWDLLTGRVTGLKGDFDVTGIAFGANADVAFAADSSGALRVCDLEILKELPPAYGPIPDAREFTFSADGRHVLVWRKDFYEVWDARGGRPVGTLRGTENGVTCKSLGADGTAVLFGAGDGGVQLWKIGATDPSLKLMLKGPIHSVALSRDAAYAVIGSGDHDLQILDIGKQTLTRSLHGHRAKVNCVAFSPDGQTVLSGSSDHTVRLWNWRDGSEICCFHGHKEAVLSIAFRPDGRAAVSGGGDCAVVWPILAAGAAESFESPDHVSNVAISADGRIALAGCDDGSATLWDLRSHNVLLKLAGQTGPIERVALSPDGRTALGGGFEGQLLLLNLEKKLRPRAVGPTSQSINSLAISPDGGFALSGAEGTATFWDLNTSTPTPIAGHDGAVKAVAFSPNGRWAMSGSGTSKGILLLHNLAAPTIVTEPLTGDFGIVHAIAFSPDGRTALTGDGENLLHLWDLRAHNIIATMPGHSGVVAAVAFGPDGRTAFSGSWDKSIRMWDLATGKELRVLAEGIEAISCIALSADGMTLVAGGATDAETHRIRTWDFSRGRGPERFEKVRELTYTPKPAPPDPVSLATLGEWYAFEGRYDWAVEVLTRSRAKGNEVDPTLLAQCYWALSRDFPPSSGLTPDECRAAAKRQFDLALSRAESHPDLFYLKLCAAAFPDEAH
jgi:WD40 repeat protein/serine/threonine protein kinase